MACPEEPRRASTIADVMEYVMVGLDKHFGEMSEVTHTLTSSMSSTLSGWYDDEDEVQAVKSADPTFWKGNSLTHFRKLTDSWEEDLQKSRTFSDWLADASTFDSDSESDSFDSMEAPVASMSEEADAKVIEVGMSVCVREDFMSDSVDAVLLEKGQVGIVWMVDEEGDIGIDFGAHAEGQWVRKTNLTKLASTADEAVDADSPAEDFLTQFATAIGLFRK